MSKSLLILGAGGHGRVVADTAEAAGWSDVAFLDDDLASAQGLAWPVLGPLAELVHHAPSFNDVIVAIADAQCRQSFIARVEAGHGNLATVISPAASVSVRASIEPGCVVLAGAVVQAGAQLGVGCIVNTAATVDHDCVLGRYVHVAPGAHLAGAVTVGQGSWIGIGSTVNDGLVIGQQCVVGAGAAVVTHVDDGATVVGVPARPVR